MDSRRKQITICKYYIYKTYGLKKRGKDIDPLSGGDNSRFDIYLNLIEYILI